MKNTLICCSIALLLLTSSCATIISGSNQKVNFTSTPSAAGIFIDDLQVGFTPKELQLERKKEYNVMIKLEGYTTYETRLTRKFNAWYLGNIALGGIIGLVIDPITGAMYKLTPKQIDAQMSNGVVFKQKRGEAYVAVVLEVDPNWVQVAQLEIAK